MKINVWESIEQGKKRNKKLAATVLGMKTVCISIVLLMVSGHCFAQQPNPNYFSLGAVGLYMPEYEGSDEMQLLGFPSIAFKKDRWQFDAVNGLRYNFSSDGNYSYGPLVHYFFGREESDSAYLTGLGDIDYGLEMGAYLNYSLVGWTLGGSVHRDLSKQVGGLRLKLAADRMFMLNRSNMVSVQVDTEWVDEKYADAFFTISTEQALATDYAVYNASNGLKHAGVSATWIHIVNPHWQAIVGVNAKVLVGSAVDSPLVFDDTLISTVAGVVYRF